MLKKYGDLLYAYRLAVYCFLVFWGIVIGIYTPYMVSFIISIIVLIVVFVPSDLIVMVFISFIIAGVTSSYLAGQSDKERFLEYLDVPIYYEGTIVSVPYTKGLNDYAVFAPEKLKNSADEWVNVSNVRILLNIKLGSELSFRDKVTFLGVVKQPEVFEDFDYAYYLKTMEIDYVGDAVSDVELMSHSKNIFPKYTNRTRDFIDHVVNRNFREPNGSLLKGMLIGSKEEFSDDFNQVLRDTGTSHVIAVSGYNVSLIVIAIMRLAGTMPRKVVYVLTFLVLVYFILIVGLENIPALRATIMGFVVIIGKVLGRRGNAILVLVLTGTVLFIFNPLVLSSISFQLSFAATMGMILLATYLQIKLGFLPEVIREEAAVSIAASLATAPVTIYHFGFLSLISVFVNILVAPLVSTITLLGIIFIFLHSVHLSIVAGILRLILWSVIEMFIKAIEFSSNHFSLNLELNEDQRLVPFILIIVSIVVLIYLSHRKSYED